MNLCFKCVTSKEHPFHDNGTVNQKDIIMWINGNHAFTSKHDSKEG